MSEDDVTIVLGPLAGTGTPPNWAFRVTHQGAVLATTTGPRFLVLIALLNWVRLFEEESRPESERES